MSARMDDGALEVELDAAKDAANQREAHSGPLCLLRSRNGGPGSYGRTSGRSTST